LVVFICGKKKTYESTAYIGINTIYKEKSTAYKDESSSSTCIWSIHLSVDMNFKSLWFLSWFPW